MLPTTTSTPATLKQYNKDQPPGWRPRAYPLREYKENLLIWSRLTRLTEQQAGAAVMSRLEGSALKRAKTLKVTRLNFYQTAPLASLPTAFSIQDAAQASRNSSTNCLKPTTLTTKTWLGRQSTDSLASNKTIRWTSKNISTNGKRT